MARNMEEADDPDESSELKNVVASSFNEVPPVDLNFMLAWSVREHRS